MSERSLLDRSLLIVTGKGGVGKTTVAAALAWAAAQQGKRVLAVELDAKGDLDASLVGPGVNPSGPPSYEPQERQRRLWVMAMDPEESLKEYLRIFLKLPIVTRVGLLSGIFDFVANAAPGVREVVTVGKFAYEVRERNYDIVIVDATATGHVIGQLDAPQAINDLVGAGLIRGQTEWMRDILTDHQRTALVAVTTAEEMPVVETIELVGNLRSKVHVHLGAVVINRVLDEPFTRKDNAVFESLAADPKRLAAAFGVEPGGVDALVASTRLALDLRRTREPHLTELFAALGDTPTALVPWLPETVPGLAMVQAVAEHLAAELGWM